jgi:HD-like signal output (HDOD) protein
MISRSIALHRILEDESLKQMISGMEALPTLPSLYLDIMKEIQSENGSLARIGQIIATDIGMSAKILQLVNSAFFGLPNTMANPAQAAIYLGMDTIRSLVLSVHIFSRFTEGRLAGIGLDALWRHSMTVASSAKEIVALEGGGQSAMDFAFVAGLLHDVGKIVLAVNLPDRYQRVAEAAEKLKLSDVEAERRIFSVTHAEIGAYLLGIWGLQDPLVEAVCFHHNPDASPNLAFSPLMAVHVANGCYGEALVGGTVANCTKLDINYLNKVGRGERLPVWFEACRIIAQKGGSNGGKNSVR